MENNIPKVRDFLQAIGLVKNEIECAGSTALKLFLIDQKKYERAEMIDCNDVDIFVRSPKSDFLQKVFGMKVSIEYYFAKWWDFLKAKRSFMEIKTIYEEKTSSIVQFFFQIKSQGSWEWNIPPFEYEVRVQFVQVKESQTMYQAINAFDISCCKFRTFMDGDKLCTIPLNDLVKTLTLEDKMITVNASSSRLSKYQRRGFKNEENHVYDPSYEIEHHPYKNINTRSSGVAIIVVFAAVKLRLLAQRAKERLWNPENGRIYLEAKASFERLAGGPRSPPNKKQRIDINE